MMGIYTIKNLITGTLYIGSAVNIERRLKHHKYKLKCNKHFNPHLQGSVNKYGFENFRFQAEELVENKEDLILIEQQWLDVLWGNFELYNMCRIANSTLGKKHSEEAKLKMSEAQQKGMWALGKKHSEEIKKKISEASKGNKSFLGRKHSEETKLKMSNVKKGEKCYMFGKHPSEETRKKQGEARKGEKNHNYGKIFSEETRERMSKAAKNRWAKRA